METVIRAMEVTDSKAVLDMMTAFYRSPAVHTNGSEEIFLNDVNTCLENNPYLEGYVFEGCNGLQGYAMVAKSFSTEFGKSCIWIEDLYLLEEYRGCGIGGQFFAYIEDKYKNAVLRLEVEEENANAVNLYRSRGFDVLPYLEMIRL